MNEEWRKFDLRTYPLDPLPDLPAFATLMDIWNDKRDGARLPAWPDFDFDTVLPWVGRLAISEFDGKDEFHFVLFGGAFVNLFGRELTGKPLFASLHPDQEPHSRQHFMAMLKGPLIGHGQAACRLSAATTRRST